MDSKQDWVADAKAMRDGQVGHHSVLKPPIPYIVSGPNFTSLTVVIGVLNQEKVLVGAFTVITNLRVGLRLKL